MCFRPEELGQAVALPVPAEAEPGPGDEDDEDDEVNPENNHDDARPETDGNAQGSAIAEQAAEDAIKAKVRGLGPPRAGGETACTPAVRVTS